VSQTLIIITAPNGWILKEQDILMGPPDKLIGVATDIESLTALLTAYLCRQAQP
jgi:hypothetical protein